MTDKLILLETVSSLINSRDLNLDKNIDVTGQYTYNVVGNYIFVTVKNIEDIKDFAKLKRDAGETFPTYDNMTYETALEMLYHHYPYGHTNGSNCFLVNEKYEVLAVQWNSMKHNSFIMAKDISKKWFIVFNNKIKLEASMLYKDAESVRELFNKLRMWYGNKN